MFYLVDWEKNFRDRIKDLLKVDNHWFGPGEVEDTLEELPGTTAQKCQG
jgi:hypothetical protein